MTEVSVLTPSYGYARFIEDAVISVRAQLGGTVEHVIQDGASSDGTVSLLGKYDWLSVRSERDGGQSQALNRALARANGEWVGWLNADEFYLPEGLAQLLRATMDADVVFGDCIFVDVAGRFMRLLPQHRLNRRILRWYGPTVPSCAMLIRRSVLGAAGAWDEQVDRIMDWELYLRLLERGARFRWVPAAVGAFRVHDDRITARPESEDGKSFERVIDRYSLPTGRVAKAMGRGLHGLLKLASRSYIRQVKAASLRGSDMRWFASEPASKSVERLIRSCY